ncbi:MAG: hypothetical protein IRY87_12575 [Acetobacteraceae bacterium]|nr:hypothetical protein [Acetobacteraceae bacterium]
MMPKPAQKAATASTQSDLVDTSGATSIDIAVTGTQAGAMHHINAGNSVAAAQSNNSVQKAAGQGDGSLIIQDASQSNIIDASGDVRISIVIEGDQKGAIHHINVGNIVAALQSNDSIQFAVQDGGGSVIVQASWQSNLIDASGNATLLLVIKGNHKGAIHHIDVGNIITGEQSNDAIQLAAQEGAGSLAIQDVSQSNVIDGSGDSTLQLILGDDQQGAIHHIHAGNISGAEQSNEALQISLQGSSDWIL